MTPLSEQATGFYRRQRLALRAAATRDAMRLWPTLDWRRLDETYPAWATAVGTLVERDRARATALAADYLTVIGAAEAVDLDLATAGAVPTEQLATSLRVTSIVAFRRGLGAGMTFSAASDNALVQNAGAVSRLVLAASNETVMRTATGAGGGWQRVTSGRGCNFCVMLAGRGAVYRESSASFDAHDHCACSAVPVFTAAAA